MHAHANRHTTPSSAHVRARTHKFAGSVDDQLFCRLLSAAMVAVRAPRLCSWSHSAAAEREKQALKGTFRRLLSCPGTQAPLSAALGMLGLRTRTSEPYGPQSPGTRLLLGCHWVPEHFPSEEDKEEEEEREEDKAM